MRGDLHTCPKTLVGFDARFACRALGRRCSTIELVPAAGNGSEQPDQGNRNWKMKTLSLALLVPPMLIASASAFAADLAARPYTKAPPAVVAAVGDWSGFYVGVNAGG